ncbi:hypothetical protein J1N35_025183 [Gossypium stocksii]|uniref:Uncharacterized protein n=1 Tax=Gossypium stocksii TaxID=47602 RepID=A0A9D3ZVY8_9ROSI|nr:hypothetical protein J1N35_025183 [Gossypium stocksii]
MRFFAERKDNGALDVNTQIEIVFKSLTKEFTSFRVAHNLGNKKLTLSHFISYELMLNGGKPVQEKPEANLVAGPSSFKGKKKAKGK